MYIGCCYSFRKSLYSIVAGSVRHNSQETRCFDIFGSMNPSFINFHMMEFVFFFLAAKIDFLLWTQLISSLSHSCWSTSALISFFRTVSHFKHNVIDDDIINACHIKNNGLERRNINTIWILLFFASLSNIARYSSCLPLCYIFTLRGKDADPFLIFCLARCWWWRRNHETMKQHRRRRFGSSPVVPFFARINFLFHSFGLLWISRWNSEAQTE